MLGCSPIVILCSDDIYTQIIKGDYSLQAQYGESMQKQAAKMIVHRAYYNEVFEVQADKTGDFERAVAEANQFKMVLREAMTEKPELNLMILGDNPKQWESRKAQSTHIQRAILRKIKMVADKMAAYPALLTEIDLQKKADIASDSELLKAKRFVETVTKPIDVSIDLLKNHHAKPEALNPWPMAVLALLCLLGAAVLLVLVATSIIPIAWTAIGLTIGLMFLGTAMLGISVGMTSGKDSDMQSIIDHFNFRTGRSDMIPELSKISPEFLKK